MSSVNMDKYILKHYPNNFSNFEKKNYRQFKDENQKSWVGQIFNY